MRNKNLLPKSSFIWRVCPPIQGIIIRSFALSLLISNIVKCVYFLSWWSSVPYSFSRARFYFFISCPCSWAEHLTQLSWYFFKWGHSPTWRRNQTCFLYVIPIQHMKGRGDSGCVCWRQKSPGTEAMIWKSLPSSSKGSPCKVLIEALYSSHLGSLTLWTSVTC